MEMTHGHYTGLEAHDDIKGSMLLMAVERGLSRADETRGIPGVLWFIPSLEQLIPPLLYCSSVPVFLSFLFVYSLITRASVLVSHMAVEIVRVSGLTADHVQSSSKLRST